MSSTQSQHDLIHFNTKNGDNDVDVLDKPNTGIVQQMVMSENASASLIATAVAKLTTSSVTTQAPSTPVKSTITMIAANKSESESQQSMDEKLFDNATAIDNTVTTTSFVVDQQINKNQSAENALSNEIILMNTDQVKKNKNNRNNNTFTIQICIRIFQ